MAQLLNKQQFIIAFNAAPKAVRDVMSGNDTIDTIEHIQAAYNLHADVAGKISEELGFMLLGLLDPSTFYQNLIDLGIDATSATAIIKEVNERIFQPLQAKVREAASAPIVEEEEEEPEAVYDPNLDDSFAQAATEAPAPAFQVPVMQVTAPREQQPPAPAAAPAYKPAPAPSYNLVQQQPAYMDAAPAQYRTMQGDMNAMQHPDQYANPAVQASAPRAPHPSQVMPARSFQTASVPFTAPPRAPVPVYEPAPRATLPYQNVPVTTPAAPQFPPVSSAPAPRDDSSDPYREPVN